MVKYKLSFLTLLTAIVTSISLFSVNAESIAYIELYLGGDSFVYVDEYIEPTDHLVAQQIFERKINEPLGVKLAFIQNKLRGGADYKSALLTCFPRLELTVKAAIAKLNKEPTDSEIRFDPNSKPMFTIARDRSGVKVLEDRLYMDIYFALTADSHVRVKIPIEQPKAQITTQDNILLTNLRARYSTDFSSSSAERKHNVSLALSKISGTVLNENQELSFNEKVGRRTAQNGFKEAKIIVNGRYVPGLGGGVCQASTTLYNAALLSDLEILSVSRHSLQSSYELPSFDAMVNAGSSDLKIKNNGERPIFIRAYTSDTRAYVEIYGTELPYVIKRKSEVTYKGETPDYDEFEDTFKKHFSEADESGARKIISYSHPELHSNGYLLYYDKYNRLIKSKLIRTDKYFAVKGVIAINP